MAFRIFNLKDSGEITIFKRRGSKSIRLSVGSNGRVRVTIPAWASYNSGLDYARSHHKWIIEHKQTTDTQFLQSGQAIGKGHHLKLRPHDGLDKPFSKLQNNEIIISYPSHLEPTSLEVQTSAHKASIRALRQQAEVLLPKRLIQLANENKFEFSSISVKHLRGRWGSCDSQKNIVFNLFLLQLPWSLIDYVVLHELTHTEHLNHSQDFWSRLQESCPDYQVRRKDLKNHKPVVLAQRPI